MIDLASTLATARRHHKDGDASSAEQLYRQVLWSDPCNAEVSFFLAMACRDQGRMADAQAHLQKALAVRPNYAEAHNAQALISAAKGDMKEALESFRQALRLKPEYAEAHHNLGVALARGKKLDEAIAAFRQAIKLKPDYADAFLNLARAFEQQGKFDEAIAVYQGLVHLRSEDAAVRNSFGLMLAKRNKTAEAVTEFRQAVKLAPGQANYHNNLGVALTELGQPNESLEEFEEAVRLSPEHAEAHKSLGMTRLHLRDFERGWDEYEWRLKCKDFTPRSYPQPFWDGTDLHGRRILVYTEQGIGDIFQFVRYVPLLAERGALAFVECPKSLVPILSTCPGAAKVVAHGSPLPEFECHVALISLPRLLGTTSTTIPAQIPYLTADAGLVERWRRELSSSRDFKVGIAWQGNPKNGSDIRRSVPLRHFAPLAAVPGVELFSLQKGTGAEQMADVLGQFPVTDLGARLDFGAFMMTAGALSNLDLIVACDTSTAHLAGALGRPVWLAISFASDWRWQVEREDSPWYPTMRIFRQPKLGDWPAVFEKIADALRRLVAVEEIETT